MEKETRNRIQHATQAARKLLEVEFAAQLEGTFDIRPDGTVASEPGRHLAEDPDALRVRAKLVEAVAHHRALGEKPADAVKSVLRASAFTTLNRFVALKMLEARKIVQECVSKGLESSGFKNEFLGLADGLKVQPDAAYKLYLECLFDEIGREVRVLFDRRDPASLLWPRRTALDNLLGIVNDPELATVWGEDETIGWVYQYFNGEDERRQMRAESQAPRNSRELAVRNQFFTPRYVVEFLTDNTLGRTWVEMRQGHTRLMEQCRYLVRRPSEVFLRQGEEAPPEDESAPVEQRTVYVPFRAKKDPRELRVLDPACGSGHFLLYSFDVLLAIYEEAWADPELGPKLWNAVVFVPDVKPPSDERPVDLRTVARKPGADGYCFSCGWTGPADETRFVLMHRDYPWFGGRPMTYCSRCAAPDHPAILLNLPLTELDVGDAVQRGWFSHSTARSFLELAKIFTFQDGGAWVLTLEKLEAALRPDAIAKLHHVLPGLILRHNMHGVDIDPRAAQIAAMALWMRAQRAWNDFDVRRADRPLVTRTNIVVAEPMPGEPDLRKEFLADLEPPIAHLTSRMFEAMEWAGEAGTLLRIEDTLRDAIKEAKASWVSRPKSQALFPEYNSRKAEQLGVFDPRSVTDAKFWDDAEGKVLVALKNYAEGVQGGAGYRRRLFAEDAARGFAFIDVCGKRYDVVLMNPPFGYCQESLAQLPYIDRITDIDQLFVDTGLFRMARTALLGAIVNRTQLFKSALESFRESSMLGDSRLEVLADLGQGVLDALVEVCAYTISKGSSSKDFGVIETLDQVAKQQALETTIRTGSLVRVPHVALHAIPAKRLAHGLPPALLSVFARVQPLGSSFHVAFGLSTTDNDRFLRLRWETSAEKYRVLSARTPVRERGWVPLAKGGEYAPYWSDIHLTVKWHRNGHELRAMPGAPIRNEARYGLPGLTYSKRTASSFAVRCLPAGCIMEVNGPGIQALGEFDRNHTQALAVMLNSRLVGALVDSLSAAGDNSTAGSPAKDYIPGIISTMPDATTPGSDSVLAGVGERAISLRMALDGLDETTTWFRLPISLQSNDFIALSASEITMTLEQIWAAEAEIEHSRVGLRAETRSWLDSHIAVGFAFSADGSPVPELEPEPEEQLVREALSRGVPARQVNKNSFKLDKLTELVGLASGTLSFNAAEDALRRTRDASFEALSMASWSAGVAFGRFDLRLATGERPLPPEPDPFDPLPACSPGMLTGADGLPLAAPPPNYPIPFPTDGILVDDPGHDRDILARIHQVFTVLFGDNADDRLQEAVTILDPSAKDLRPWLRRTFFEEHIQRYSKSRRKAPIYWRLGTPSGSYSVWIYLHRFNKDTLHRVLNDHVTPKLRYESNKLESLRSEAGPSPTPSQRKTLDAQETFVDELRCFSDEVGRVAPLWDPDLDDGVVINASFLHRLFAHTRAWQKECESHWQKLQKGEYDWAHLAMRLWPERVVPKCTEDRSLAIAHGLEDVLWLEGTDGKWRPQHVTDAEVAALVQERMSTAVKDALRRMGETPEPVVARKVRTAAPAGEPKAAKAAKKAPAVQFGLGLADDPTDADLNAVRAALDGADDGLAKADVLAACGIAEDAAAAALAVLVQTGEVDKIGAGRGTKYRLGGGV